jgi:hypothetical protein
MAVPKPSMLLRVFGGFCGLVLAAGCVTAVSPGPEGAGAFQLGPVCAYESIRFDGSIGTGRLNGCRRHGPDAFTLYIHPEDAPINPSSWYAFNLTSDTQAHLDLTLAYSHGRHRYVPHVSSDGGQTWRTIDRVEGADTDRASFGLDIAPGTILISAQPRRNLADRQAWVDRIAAMPSVTGTQYGTSEQGRSLEGLEFGAEDKPALILTGGQHPPEVRGAIAMESFVERLLEDDLLACTFRERFRVVLGPVINPDGIAEGNWRHNSRGVDVNRDWGPFTQAETRSFKEWIDKRVSPVAFIDFHGTWNSVLYTSPDEGEGDHNWFPGAFHASLAEVLGEDAPARVQGHNAGSSVAKNWFHETYAIPTMTYEVGDAVPLEAVLSRARLSAEITMRLLLEGPPDQPDDAQDGEIPK